MYFYSSGISSSSCLIFKFYAFAARSINHTAAVRTSLFLVLFLCEALALGYNEVGVRAVGVVVGYVCVAGELGIDPRVGLDALKAVLDMVLLSLGLVGGV
jgi:hypothetical protein